MSGALTFAMGCEELKPDTQDQKIFRLSVSMPEIADQQPKTHIERLGEVYRTYWSNGDDISINGHISSPLYSDGKHCAEFIFNGYAPEEGETMNILHPGTSEHRFTIPFEQTYVNGRYPSVSAPMWSSAVKGTDVTMNHLCSILSVNFHGTGNISKVELTAAGGEYISGEFLMGFSDGAYNGSVTGGSSSHITISFSPAVNLSSDKAVTLNLPVLAGRYSKGFTAKIYDSEGKFQRIKMYSAGKVLDPLKVYERPDDLFNPTENTGSISDMNENILFDYRTMTVGTYNILASSARTDVENNTWDAAKGTIAKIISEMNCDVMTLNELFNTEIEYLRENLTDVEWVLHPNYDNGYTFAPGIIYNPSRLEKLEDGIFWLSAANAITIQKTQGCYWYLDLKNLSNVVVSAGEHRSCVWAKFNDKLTDNTFYYFATHPETRGADSGSSNHDTLDGLNAGNIRSLAAQVPLVNTENLPFIVAGDMNTHSNHISYSIFASAGWTDSFTAASSAKCLDEETKEKPGTDIKDNISTEARRIDLVLYNGFDVSSYCNIFTKYNNIYPSDHIPVRVELRFSNR